MCPPPTARGCACASPRPIPPTRSCSSGPDHRFHSNRGRRWRPLLLSQTLVVDPSDLAPEGLQPLLYSLVAPVDLAHVVDGAFPRCAEGGLEEGHAGPNVGARYIFASELRLANHNRPVRVAEHDARPHADEPVHEEEAVLEHLLKDEHCAFRLGGGHQGDADEVGREGGPDAVVYLG